MAGSTRGYGVTSNGLRASSSPTENLLRRPSPTNNYELAQQFIKNLNETRANEAARALFGTARSEYPVLNQHPLQFKFNPQDNGAGLEFWPPDEPGSPEWPRPKDFGIGGAGVEVFKEDVRPRDIMGDAASHYLNYGRDPQITSTYNDFEASLTGKQRDILREQYDYAKKNFSETRSYEDWEKTSGLPSAFRGYAFDQWPKDFNDAFYTPEQKRMFDAMNVYLRPKR